MLSKHAFWLAVGLLAVFVLVKAANIASKISDENFYFFASHLLAQGVLPYRDFFFQHLPGQLLLQAFLIKVFGFNLFLLKLIPILFHVGSGYLIFKIGEAGGLGKLGGITAAAFFLFSFTVLTTSDHGSGVHEAVFWLVLSFYLLGGEVGKIGGVKGGILAGLAAFAGLTTRIYILPAILGFSVYLFLTQQYKKFCAYVASFLLPFLVLNIGLYYWLGEKFLLPVWQYHFLKSEGISKAKILLFFVQNEWLLLGLGTLGLLIVLFSVNSNSYAQSSTVTLSGDKNNKSVYSLFLATILALSFQGVFLLIFADIYYLYLVTLVVFLAILAAFALGWLLDLPQREGVLAGILVVFAAFNLYVYLTSHAPQSRFNADKIAEDVRAITNPQDTIFGSYTVAPLIALKAGRGVTENQLDTNAKRYYSGLISREELIRLATESAVFLQLALVEPQPKTIQTEAGKIRSLDMDYISETVIRDKCELFRVYPVPVDYERNAILLWKCKK